MFNNNNLGFRIVNFWNSMPKDIVIAPSVNIFKGRFDKEYAYLHYYTDIDYIGVWEMGRAKEHGRLGQR